MVEYSDKLVGRNILITGGAGFIGSNMVDALASQNKVVVVDDLSSCSLADLAKSKDKVKFVQGDIRNKGLVTSLASDAEYVFHLAANAGNVKSIEDPIFDMDVNITGTLNLLEACLVTYHTMYSIRISTQNKR